MDKSVVVKVAKMSNYQLVEEFIKENNLDAQIVDFEFEDGLVIDPMDTSPDNSYCRFQVEVNRQDYERAIGLESYFKDYSIRWHQRKPELVSAEVGDLVLIYNQYETSNEDVGFVSSKFVDSNNRVYYGCRYVKVGLNNQYLSSTYDFELTSEDYGGYQEGFLQVITPEQAIDILRNKLNLAFEKEKESIQIQFERSNKNLEKLVDHLGKIEKVKCDKAEFGDNYCLGLKME